MTWAEDLAKGQRAACKALIVQLFAEHARGDYADTIMGSGHFSIVMVQYGLMTICMLKNGHYGFGQEMFQPLVQSILDEMVEEGALLRGDPHPPWKTMPDYSNAPTSQGGQQ